VQGAEPELSKGLVLEAPQATGAFLRKLDQLFPPGATQVQGDAGRVIDLADQTLAVPYRQVDANLAVLDLLIARRAQHPWTQLWISLAVTATGLLLAVFLAVGFYRAMFGGFKALRRHLLAISMGDLRAQIHGRGRDEVSDLLREVGYLQASLRETVQQVQGASDSVVQARLEIATGKRDLSSRTEAAAAALGESSAALEETTSSMEHTAGSARQASHIAVDNARVAEFRLPGTATTTKQLVEGIDVDVYIDAHRQWKVKLRDAIENREKVDMTTLSRDDCCVLGKWIYGDGQRLGARPFFSIWSAATNASTRWPAA